MKHRNTEAKTQIVSFINDYSRHNQKSPSIRQISAATGITRMTVQRMLKTLDEEDVIDYDGESVITDLSMKMNNETTSVGILGDIPCGNLALEEEAIEEIIQLPVNMVGRGDLFMLHARGDSMTGAGIDDGDLVLIRKQEEAYPGDIVVAYVEGEGNTLKTYKRYGNTVFLHPENAKYPDIPVKNCKIQGVAIFVTKALGKVI